MLFASTLTAYPVTKALYVAPGSTGIDLRYLFNGVDISIHAAVVVLQFACTSVHADGPVPNIFSAIPVDKLVGKFPLLSTIYSWIAVRIVSTSAVRRLSRESASLLIGLRATKTVTASAAIMVITIRSSMRVNPF